MEQKKKEKIKKICTRVSVAVLVAVPVLWCATQMMHKATTASSGTQALKIARLDTIGLTADEMLTQEDLNRQIRYGLLQDAATPVNVGVLCEGMQNDLLNEYWMDTSMTVEVSRSLRMETVTAIMVVKTKLEEDKIANSLFDIYSTNRVYLEAFDRVLLSVNDSVFEQSKLRVEGGMPFVTFSIPVDALDSTEFITNAQLAPLTEILQQDIAEKSIGDTIYLRYAADVCNSTENLLSDYLTVFKSAYAFLNTHPKKTIVLAISCADSRIEIMIDIFRAYEFGYIASKLGGLAAKSYTLQYHSVYSRMSGTVKNEFEELYYGFIG